MVIMCSNEHLDMSGNLADAQILCDHCGEPVREDHLFGSPVNDEMSFCSEMCVTDWEDRQFDNRLPSVYE